MANNDKTSDTTNIAIVQPAIVPPVIPVVPPVQPPAPVTPIQPAPKAPSPQPAVQTTQVQPVAIPLLDYIAQLKVAGTQEEKNLIIAIETYMSYMNPGVPVKGDKGTKYQYALWKTISHILDQAPRGEFNKLWNLLLGYFNFYKEGVFNDRYIFRFAECWSWTQDELKGMNSIFNLLKLTADPATRSTGLTQVNMEKSLSVGISEEGRSRITSFYSVQ